jgi:hypothetical protein
MKGLLPSTPRDASPTNVMTTNHSLASYGPSVRDPCRVRFWRETRQITPALVVDRAISDNPCRAIRISAILRGLSR